MAGPLRGEEEEGERTQRGFKRHLLVRVGAWCPTREDRAAWNRKAEELGFAFAGLCLWHGKPGWKKQPNGSGAAGRSCTRDGYKAGVWGKRQELLPRPLQLHPPGRPSPGSRSTPAGETKQASPGSLFGKYQVLLDRLMFKLTVLSQYTRSRASAWAGVPAPSLLRCSRLRCSLPPPPRHRSRRGLGFLGKMKRSPSSSFPSPDSQSSPKKAWRELGWGPQSSWD